MRGGFFHRLAASLWLRRLVTPRILAAQLLVLSVGGVAAPARAQATGGATSGPDALQEIQQLVAKGERAKARERLAEFLKGSPNDANALNLLGVVDAQEGKVRAAEADFQKAITAAPRSASAYLNLGHLYQETAGQDSEALKKGLAVYGQLLKFDPANVEATYQSAFLLWRLGNFQASLDRLSRLPSDARARPQALALRCVDYAGLKELRRAQGAAEELLKHPDLAEADVLPLIPALLAQHQEALITKLLEGLQARHLASAETLRQLAALEERSGKLDQARATLEQAGQLGPITVPLLIELARVANQQGDNRGALGYLAHARDLEPKNPLVHFFFGIVCVEMNLVQEAYTSLQKAVQLKPNDPYYNYALGSVMMDRSNVREAYPYLKKYCALKPDDPRGRLALGAAYFYGHDLDSARRELESVLNARQTAVSAHFFLGRVENLEGHYDEASRYLEQAIKLNPRYANAYAELGILHMKQKQYAQAEKDLHKALEIEPDLYAANLNLLMLYERTKDPRAEAQGKRFAEIKKIRAEREMEFLRTIEIRP